MEKQLNRKSLLDIFSVYQQAIELVVMLIVFDRISSFLSIHTGVTYYYKGVAGTVNLLVNHRVEGL